MAVVIMTNNIGCVIYQILLVSVQLPHASGCMPGQLEGTALPTDTTYAHVLQRWVTLSFP